MKLHSIGHEIHQHRQYRQGNSHISIGMHTYYGENFKVYEWLEGASLFIGKFCSIASDVEIFLGGNHRADWITTYPFNQLCTDTFNSKNIMGHPATKGDVVIGNDVWIGAGSVILSGVTVGDGAIVGCHAIVTKNVAPYTVVAGNPARLVKQRFSDEVIQALLELKWWDLNLEIIKEIVPSLCSQPTLEKVQELVRKYRSS